MGKMELERVSKQLAELCVEKKAESVVLYALETDPLTEYVVLLTVLNPLHSNSLVVAFEKEFLPTLDSDDFFSVLKTSGSAQSGWQIADFNSIMVHLVSGSMREFYGLDKLFEKKGTVFHF